MFTRLLGFTLITILPFITFAQVDLTEGLVAYYPFNGNALDASGNGNNPIFNNAILTSDYYGNPNSAYHFNGVDNYMQIPNSKSLNPGAKISICAWVKPTGFYYGPCHGNNVVMKGNGDFQSGNYMMRFDDALYTRTNCNGGLPDTLHQTYYAIGTGLSPVQDTPYAQKNIWRSVVYTYDGSHARLYIDCNLILDTELSGLDFSNASDLFLGRLNDNQFPYWLNGDLDEVRIYNRAISANEVKAYSFSCADKEPCSNWLKINQEISGVQIGNLNVPGNQLTIEALINRTTSFPASYNGGDVVSKHDNPSDANYLLRPTVAQITTNKGFFQTNPACDIELNKTYHIAMVYDGVKLKFYRNGFLMSEVDASGDLFQNNWLTKIGTTANVNSPYPADFLGYINEVRIWNVARSQKDIKKYINQPLPNPSSQTGLLAYYTFDDLKNKQGNEQWNGSILGNASINQTNPKCSSFIADSCSVKFTNVIAKFTGPDTVCVSTPVQFNNTSTNASNYYWNFCAADFNTTPVGSNLGNPGNLLSAPVFIDYILDDNGNYYGFISNYSGGHLIRLNYGNSLLNTPTAQDLGNLGVIPSYAEGIQVKKFNNKCYAFIVSGGNALGTNSQLVRVDFGTSFSNSPTATSLGNVGGLNFPHDLFIAEDGNNFYGFTLNINDNTITKFEFGNDLSNPPTGTNLGNIGSLSYPCGFSFVNTTGNWYAFVTNRNSNTISRLKFGASLSNTPTGVNIGDPGNFLNNPRDISIFESCSGIVGLVVNEENEQTGTITKLNFSSDITSTPAAKDLGNIGGITFPHSISKFFLEGNDIYSFIPNVTTSTLTRIRYVGCNSSNIPSSTQKIPPPVTYSQAGVYNVNLLVDIGLPTETSFCKQIVVKNCACDSFKVNAGKNVLICYGSSVQLRANGATTYKWNKSAALNDTTIANPVASPLATTEFIVTGYNIAGCSDTDTVKVTVLPLPAFTLNNDTTICIGTRVQLSANSNRNYHYHWTPATYLSDTSIASPVSIPADSIKYYVTATDSNNCKSTDSLQINTVPRPVISTINNSSICFGDTVTLSTTITNANTFGWSPSSGLNNIHDQSPHASPNTSTTYTILASNGICNVKDSVLITVLSLPNVFTGNDTTTCGSSIAHLLASGANSYQWSPSTGLSKTDIANPTASPSSTTTYFVIGSDNNGCKKTDSVKVIKEPDPVFTINPINSVICSGQNVTLTASGGDNYIWSPGSSVSNASSAITIATPQTTTNYSVLISDTTCKISESFNSTVVVQQSPKINITKSNDIDCSNTQSQLNADGGIAYSWLPASYINDTEIHNPIVNPPTDTYYSVKVTAENGCVKYDSILVKSYTQMAGFYVANAFTPNGDGLNDCFGVRFWGVPATFDMMIYDKWGVPVYHSKNITECWDGTYKGKKQGSGTYVYMITATSVCGQDKVFRKGTVVLIR